MQFGHSNRSDLPRRQRPPVGPLPKKPKRQGTWLGFEKRRLFNSPGLEPLQLPCTFFYEVPAPRRKKGEEKQKFEEKEERLFTCTLELMDDTKGNSGSNGLISAEIVRIIDAPKHIEAALFGSSRPPNSSGYIVAPGEPPVPLKDPKLFRPVFPTMLDAAIAIKNAYTAKKSKRQPPDLWKKALAIHTWGDKRVVVPLCDFCGGALAPGFVNKHTARTRDLLVSIARFYFVSGRSPAQLPWMTQDTPAWIAKCMRPAENEGKEAKEKPAKNEGKDMDIDPEQPEILQLIWTHIPPPFQFAGPRGKYWSSVKLQGIKAKDAYALILSRTGKDLEALGVCLFE